MRTHHRKPRRLAAVLTSGLALTVALTPALSPTQADAHARGPRVVARGLDNPRQLSVARGGAIYVAESGRGGSGPCATGPEGDTVCLGATGAVTRIERGRQRRVVTGLPSLAQRNGSQATGPTDVRVRGHRVFVVVGLGGSPATRAGYGPGAARLGTIVSGHLGSRLRVVADVAAYEAAENPDRGAVDSNPGGFVQHRGRWVVTDAGGNDLVGIGGHRSSRTLAVFPDVMVSAPPALKLPPGTKIPMQAVPTDVAVGPDGAYYVSQLTGFPFPVGAAKIWRVVPGHAPTVYASGLTNVTGLAWSGRTLYAVQIADAGLLAGPVGSLRRVVPGGSSHPAVAAGLKSPYGVAIAHRTAYVTTCSVCAADGEVLAVPLD